MPNKIRNILILLISMAAFLASAAAASDWKITLRVSDSAGNYSYCKAGVNSTATDGRDNAWDIPAMLVNEGESGIYLYAYFDHPEWGGNFSEYAEDIKSSNFPKQWIMTVHSNVNGDLTIQWPDLAEKLIGFEAYLADMEGDGSRIDMARQAPFSFQNIPNAKRIFALSVFQQNNFQPFLITCQLAKNRKSVELSWDEPSIANIAGYDIYRRTAEGTYQKITSSIVSEPFYADMDLLKEIPFDQDLRLFYKVAAIAADPPGEVLGYSEEAVVNISSRVPHSPPKKDQNPMQHKQ